MGKNLKDMTRQEQASHRTPGKDTPPHARQGDSAGEDWGKDGIHYGSGKGAERELFKAELFHRRFKEIYGGKTGYSSSAGERYRSRLGKDACTSHKVEVRDLYNLVLKDIQELAAMALKDVESFYQRISSRMERRYLADASEMEKERERLEARNWEIDDMFLNLYTDKAKGILSEQRFVKLTAAMEREQEENQKQLKELALSLRRSNEQESDVRTFIREIRQYATIQELDEGILNRLISRILVGEVKKVDGEKFQEIKIIYNFVGEIPAVTE